MTEVRSSEKTQQLQQHFALHTEDASMLVPPLGIQDTAQPPDLRAKTMDSRHIRHRVKTGGGGLREE